MIPAGLARAWSQLADFETEAERLRATVETMRAVAAGTEGALDPAVRAFALAALHGQCPSPDDAVCAGRVLYLAVASRADFRRDADAAEVVQTPRYTLAAGGGDCDDLSTALAAALLAVGIAPVFVLGTPRADDPEPSHVLTAVELPDGKLWPLDLSLARRLPGLWPPGFRVLRIVRV